jgi:DNA-binding transcriptional regulator YhcF (GntR family)
MLFSEIKLNSDKPLYHQIENEIIKMIEGGALVNIKDL